jgi:glycosyltransferase involved in cell wall biosynthesis
MVEFMKGNSFKSLYYVPLNVLLPSGGATDGVKKAAKPSLELLFVGTLAWHKGIFELIEAMLILSRQSVRYHLNVIGEGPARKAIEDAIRERNLADYISMRGTLDRELVGNYYRLTDAVVFPSYFESFGVVALEAMSCNKHLIISNRGALVEATSGYSKLKILSQINPETIAAAIITIGKELADPRTSKSEAGPSLVLTNYTANQTARKLEEVLDIICPINCSPKPGVARVSPR